MSSPEASRAGQAGSGPRCGSPGAIPDRFPSTKRRFKLTCRACGKSGRYQLGRFVVDPQRFRKSEDVESALGFTRYVRCRHCDAGGPWEYGADVIAFSAVCLAALSGGKSWDLADEIPLIVGGMATFDRRTFLYPTEAERHLKELIEREPNNAFLWTRLGNLYRSGEAWKPASEAYKRAVALDPTDIEASFQLGNLLAEKGQWARAADCYRAVLRHARKAERCPRKLRKNLVRAAIEVLLEAHQHLGGEELDLGIGPDPDQVRDLGLQDPVTLELFQTDLGSERGMDDFCRIVLGEKPRRRRGDALAHLVAAPAKRASVHVGRNQPCSCGSGRKYKKCCGAG